MKVVAIDVDEVCADLLGEWLRRYNQEFGDSLLPEDCTDWDLTKFVVPQAKDEIYKYLTLPYLYDYVKPIEGARDACTVIRRMGHRVVFVTAGHPTTANSKYLWLVKYGFFRGVGSPERDFFPMVDKSLIRAAYLFDDSPKNVRGFPGHSVLVTRAHNESDTHPHRVSRLALAPAYIFRRENFVTEGY